MKRRFLVNYDDGTGGAWAFLMAESVADIGERFPELTVVYDRPPWMTADDVSVIEEKLTLDIDDSSAPILKQLLEARRQMGVGDLGPARRMSRPDSVACRCREVGELVGADAAAYVQHLSRVSVDNDTWDARYVCPTTGARWIESYPNGEQHGGGPPLLRRVSSVSR